MSVNKMHRVYKKINPEKDKLFRDFRECGCTEMDRLVSMGFMKNLSRCTFGHVYSISFKPMKLVQSLGKSGSTAIIAGKVHR